MTDYELVRRLTIEEAKEIVSAAQELLETTKDEVRAEYEWDVDFDAIRVNSKWARIGFKRALEAFNREEGHDY
jgi:hypothetical protein